ncbi:hypothetical protein EPR50_G00209400 [Perca flavescens]|uniref:Uncharacterized protein n=1 Tax=Perca flavescens TaxID=8167 RepID=A0A484CC16_PERFV|nr:hypothetical protein EPR50_G00209400 [Perca flavescens]
MSKNINKLAKKKDFEVVKKYSEPSTGLHHHPRRAQRRIKGFLQTNKRFIKGVEKLSPHHQTSSLEAFHSVVIRFTPKSVVYPFIGMLYSEVSQSELSWTDDLNDVSARRSNSRDDHIAQLHHFLQEVFGESRSHPYPAANSLM